jgi:hypothetical protein
MSKHFYNKERRTGFAVGLLGTGNFSITNIPFLPDYMKAKFATQGTYGRQHDGKAAVTDYLYWELIAVSPTNYTFKVYYKCSHPRDVQWVVTKLPKNAEIISH